MDDSAVWEIVEEAAGQIAGEIRRLLKQPPIDARNFGAESQARRIAAMIAVSNGEEKSDQERHAEWISQHEQCGWVWGEDYNEANKTHPNLVPWDQLPHEVIAKIRVFNIMARLGAAIVQLSTPSSEMQKAASRMWDRSAIVVETTAGHHSPLTARMWERSAILADTTALESDPSPTEWTNQSGLEAALPTESAPQENEPT